MKIHAIRTGSVRVKTQQITAGRPGPLGMLGIFVDPVWSGWLPSYAWAIEHEEGVIVVDTGQTMGMVEAAARSLHPFLRYQAKFEMQPEDEVGPQLRALGIGPRDVKTVVLTHMHVDHDAGLNHFPHSRIMAAAGEIAGAKGVRGAIMGYLPGRWPEGMDPIGLHMQDGAFGPFAASQKLTRKGDVVVVATPGHTPNHVSVIADLGDTSAFIAGDVSYNQATLLAGTVDGVSMNANLTRQTLANVRAFAKTRPTIYLPTHDPEAGRRLAEREAVAA